MRTIVILTVLFLLSLAACEKKDPQPVDPCTYGNNATPKEPAPYNKISSDARVMMPLYHKFVYNCYNGHKVTIVFQRASIDDCWNDPIIDYDICQ